MKLEKYDGGRQLSPFPPKDLLHDLFEMRRHLAIAVQGQASHREVVTLAVDTRRHYPHDHNRAVRFDAEDDAELAISDNQLSERRKIRAERATTLSRVGSQLLQRLEYENPF
ncbi:hypothetical protein [Prauserella marina]|uniref:hypothetical protein n=1 Tax=Prauserella marina TaxID=530584 RepID=UPI00115FBB18|nr:hypothetical protein [Prauserella marina]